MNDEQLDKILKKALTPQREIKEEEIVLKKRRKEEKMIRKKRMKMAGIVGTVAAALALACIVPQTSFAEQLKKMFQGYWGQRSELADYVTRGVFSDQDEHMIFSVEEITLFISPAEGALSYEIKVVHTAAQCIVKFAEHRAKLRRAVLGVQARIGALGHVKAEAVFPAVHRLYMKSMTVGERHRPRRNESREGKRARQLHEPLH